MGKHKKSFSLCGCECPQITNEYKLPRTKIVFTFQHYQFAKMHIQIKYLVLLLYIKNKNTVFLDVTNKNSILLELLKHIFTLPISAH